MSLYNAPDQTQPQSAGSLRPSNVTSEAQKRCAKWLALWADDGASKESLDDLENFWWKHHDRLGNLKQHNAQARRTTDK